MITRIIAKWAINSLRCPHTIRGSPSTSVKLPKLSSTFPKQSDLQCLSRRRDVDSGFHPDSAVENVEGHVRDGTGGARHRAGRPTHPHLVELGKVLYPKAVFTNAEVITYYSRIAPVLLPHLAGRSITTLRWPDGVGGQQSFGKNVPAGAPGWLLAVRLPSTGSRGSGATVRYPLFEELPALV